MHNARFWCYQWGHCVQSALETSVKSANPEKRWFLWLRTCQNVEGLVNLDFAQLDANTHIFCTHQENILPLKWKWLIGAKTKRTSTSMKDVPFVPLPKNPRIAILAGGGQAHLFNISTTSWNIMRRWAEGPHCLLLSTRLGWLWSISRVTWRCCRTRWSINGQTNSSKQVTKGGSHWLNRRASDAKVHYNWPFISLSWEILGAWTHRNKKQYKFVWYV
jgi:hypothetical protein